MKLLCVAHIPNLFRKMFSKYSGYFDYAVPNDSAVTYLQQSSVMSDHSEGFSSVEPVGTVHCWTILKISNSCSLMQIITKFLL